MASALARSTITLKNVSKIIIPVLSTPNHSSYSTGPMWKVLPSDNYTKYHEVSQDHWKFVERLRPLNYIPEPPQLPSYASGWSPAKDLASSNLPYFVSRTKNHMIPVYLRLEHVRGTRKVTIIRHIEGDIWELEKSLKSFLEKEVGRTVVSQVHEVAMFIKFRGDFVHLVKDWLSKAGF